MDLIARFEECEIPKEPHGRYHRFVIDIDMDAVRDYVMYSTGDVAWPVEVVDELIDRWLEWAAREQMRLTV